jgi:hypothetical protein
MTPTPTEEDLRKAREWLSTGPLRNADYTGEPAEVEQSLAAFRAEARRETDRKWYEDAKNGYMALHEERLAAVQAAREACERIVAEMLTEDLPKGPYDAVSRVLRRLRERAK